MSVNGAVSVYHEALLAELVSDRHQRLGDAVLAQVTYVHTGALTGPAPACGCSDIDEWWIIINRDQGSGARNPGS